MMFKYTKIKKELNKKVKNVEKEHGDYISCVLNANFNDDEHIMLVEEQKTFIGVYRKVKKELAPLEKADLIDLKSAGGYARPNKKRRNLLC